MNPRLQPRSERGAAALERHCGSAAGKGALPISPSIFPSIHSPTHPDSQSPPARILASLSPFSPSCSPCSLPGALGGAALPGIPGTERAVPSSCAAKARTFSAGIDRWCFCALAALCWLWSTAVPRFFQRGCHRVSRQARLAPRAPSARGEAQQRSGMSDFTSASQEVWVDAFRRGSVFL